MKTIFIIFFVYFPHFAHSSPTKPQFRVIGGVEVLSANAFPYQSVIFARFDYGSSLSSGSILSEKFIITCAHCIINSKNVSIFYGSDNLSDLDYTRNQIVLSENYVIHPGYSPFVNDIALISLNKGIHFDETVQPLRLPNQYEVDIDYTTKALQLASWGVYSNANTFSISLRSASMEVISNSECSEIIPANLVTSKVLCSKTSHCSGDSGSTLVERTDDNDYLAVGIASFGLGMCEEGKVNPSVYMRIASYLDFIAEIINPISS
ncbi:CLUMA_CG019795, isoform A [Clunio marinus]|uniref:CLUMA_CG019795, isoform A n=1 Tax=Clunio marinus TaxID=568069 RepID=A0A1J1J4S0_9DIPT|nr:CLUMA_CG019795, isoform A [Clunio marinus]